MKALRIRSDEAGNISSGFEEIPVSEAGSGDVLIRVAFSSINYKDALAATGAGKVVRGFPRIGGIGLAGIVEESANPKFTRGQKVLATGYGIGEASDGGYAEFARVKSEWVVPLPENLSLFESMAIGTAGFTAAQCVDRIQLLGVTPSQGKVVVTGASGGVGSQAVGMLSSCGYTVVAISGKSDAIEFLNDLGASEVLLRNDVKMGTRPLETPLWAAAVDTVGGETLSWLTRTIQPFGAIAACGLVGGIDIKTTVMPFILRGVSLLGIDSVNCPMDWRGHIWQRLATDLRSQHLQKIVRRIPFDELPGEFSAFLEGAVRGRIVVEIAPDLDQ
ncbi:MAG: oxidoreductase [Rugosibacter sp.]